MEHDKKKSLKFKVSDLLEEQGFLDFQDGHVATKEEIDYRALLRKNKKENRELRKSLSERSPAPKISSLQSDFPHFEYVTNVRRVAPPDVLSILSFLSLKSVTSLKLEDNLGYRCEGYQFELRELIKEVIDAEFVSINERMELFLTEKGIEHLHQLLDRQTTVSYR